MESSKSIESLLNSLMDENTDIVDKKIKDFQLEDEFINKWDIISFTDGSCIGKRAGAKFGGAGIYTYSTKNVQYNGFKSFKRDFGETLLYMSLDNKIIEYSKTEMSNNLCDNEECNKIAYTDNIKCSKHKTTDSKINAKYFTYNPTNIRAEGYAILYAMEINLLFLTANLQKNTKNIKQYIEAQNQNLLNNELDKINNKSYENTLIDMGNSYEDMDFDKSYKYVLIVSDSQFWIDLITKWMNNWISKRILVDKKNLDIIIMIYNMLSLYSDNNIKLCFQHVEGHKDKKEKEENLNVYYKGNILADKLATHASKSDTKDFIMLK